MPTFKGGNEVHRHARSTSGAADWGHNGPDHTPIVCSVTKKFDVAKYFMADHARASTST
jgi:hypothetical protein